MPESSVTRREARVVYVSESGGVFADKWFDCGCVSIHAAAIAGYQATYGYGYGPKRTVEVRDQGSEKTWQLTVEPQKSYEVKSLCDLEPSPAEVREAMDAIAKKTAR